MAFGQAVRAWFAISLQTFGGPAGQIAVMQRELVDQRRWFGQRPFLHALSNCTLLPGPAGAAALGVRRLVAQRGPRRTGRGRALLCCPASSLAYVAHQAVAVDGWLAPARWCAAWHVIFLGAPYVEQLRGNRSLTALAGITAPVVGVIASLAVYFGLHTLFTDTDTVQRGVASLELPVVAGVDWIAVAIAAVAAV